MVRDGGRGALHFYEEVTYYCLKPAAKGPTEHVLPTDVDLLSAQPWVSDLKQKINTKYLLCAKNNASCSEP